MKPEVKHDPTEQLVGCALLVATLPFTTTWWLLVGGYTLTTMWGWFVAPHFAVSPLPLPIAAGVMLLLAFLRVRPTEQNDESAYTAWKKALGHYVFYTIYAAMVLGEGYVIHRIWL